MAFQSNVTFEQIPEHTEVCEEFWSEGMRCHCPAWWAENQ